jgi:hypothetical protein
LKGNVNTTEWPLFSKTELESIFFENDIPSTSFENDFSSFFLENQEKSILEIFEILFETKSYKEDQ